MSATPTIVIISSLVSTGRVGARATAFALEQLGFETAIIPTVTMPYHPGQGASTRCVPAPDVFAAQLDELADHLAKPVMLITGYLANAGQATAIRAFIEKTKPIHYLCDPVIGDNDALYVAEDTAAAIRDEIMPLATMATPNLFELGWLSGLQTGTMQEILAAARSFDCPQIAITSAPPMLKGHIGTILVDPAQAVLAESRYRANAPHGVGDMFAGLMLGHTLLRGDAQAALPQAVGAVSEAVNVTTTLDQPELSMVPVRQLLRQPRVPVPLRKVG